MASVLALVSKGVFEKDAPAGLAPGGLWKLDRYLGQNPGLRALSEGGALFLVTVRPPGEQLWLVAVLEDPRADAEGWKAAVNAAPVRDVTALVPNLKLASGKGLAPAPGKLGMSLQTPRALSAADVALLRGAASDAPAGPSNAAASTPGPAPEASAPPAQSAALERRQRALASLRAASKALPRGVADELATLEALAAKSPAKAAAGAKALAKKLGEGEPAIAVYDAVAAAICAGSSKAKSAAGDCHAAARLIERKLKRAPQLDVAVERALVLAESGAVWVKELALLAKALGAARRADLAPGVVEAAVAAVRAGEVPAAALLTALRALAPSAALAALAGFRGVEGALARAEDDFWTAAAPSLPALLDTDEGLRWAADFAPAAPRTPEWLAAWAACEVPRRVAAALPPRALALAERCMAHSARLLLDAPALARLEALLAPLLPALRARGEALPVAVTPALSGAEAGLHDPTIIELLLALDAPLRVDDARPLAFPLYAWAQHPLDAPHQQLVRVGAHPVFAACFEAGLREVANSGFAAFAAKAAQAEGTRAALVRFVDDLVGERLVDRGTLGTFVSYAEALGHLCQPAVLALTPRLRDAVRALDPATLLWRQLRAGLLDEWGWPALDAVYDELGANAKRAHSTFPHLVVSTPETVRVVGVEREVLRFDGPRAASEAAWIRTGMWVDGALLLVASDYSARWLPGGEPVARVGVPRLFDALRAEPGGLVRNDGTLFRRGATEGNDNDLAFFDGAAVAARDAKGVYQLHEAGSGRALGPGYPRWLAERLTAGRDHYLQEAWLLPVPERASDSPLGARAGLGGFVTWREGPTLVAEGIDGRRFELATGGSWSAINALVTFPEREGIHPLVGNTVFSPDGKVPLLIALEQGARAFWGMGPEFSGHWDRIWWHLFTPRDPGGSRALASCERERAAALYRAALDALGGDPSAPDAPPEDLSAHTPGLRVVFTPPARPRDPLSDHPALAEAVAALFPEVTHRRLRGGIAAAARLAVELAPRLADLRARVDAAAGAEQAGMTNAHVALLEPFFHANIGLPGRWGQDRLGQQINDAAEFLFGDRPVPLQRPEVLTPAPTFVAWERALLHGSELLLVLLGAAVSAPVRAQVRAFLEHYRRTPFATETRALRLVGLRFAEPPAPGIDPNHLDRLCRWDNRYFLRCTSLGGGGRPFLFAALEHAPDGRFRLPPGATLEWEQALVGPLRAESIDAALALLDARGPAPVAPAAVDALAARTGLLRESAALLLGGAHLTPLDKAGRAALDTTLKREAHARADLWAAESHFIVAGAVPADPAELYRPLDAGADGSSFVARLAERWVRSTGPRAPLTMALVERLEDDIRHPYPPFVQAARALLEPERSPMLTRDATWVHRPFARSAPDDLRWGSVPGGWVQHHDEPAATWTRRWPDREAFSYEGIAYHLKYLSWAYLELPVGDPVRASAARLAALTRARLAAPAMLLPVALGEVLDRSAFLSHLGALGGRAYAADDGGPSAAGIEADGLVVVHPGEVAAGAGFLVSLRTAALASERALERALRGLGALAREGVAELPGARVTRVLPWLAHYRLWISDGFQALVARLDAPREGVNLYDANPLRSAPAAVAALAAKHALGLEPAALYLQLATLPEPLPQRVARYNAWSRAQVDAAATVLIARRLVVSAAPRGTSRTWFLPEPLRYFQRYPGPIEASKLADYLLVEGQVPPLDVPLPVSPLGPLFEARAAATPPLAP